MALLLAVRARDAPAAAAHADAIVAVLHAHPIARSSAIIVRALAAVPALLAAAPGNPFASTLAAVASAFANAAPHLPWATAHDLKDGAVDAAAGGDRGLA